MCREALPLIRDSIREMLVHSVWLMEAGSKFAGSTVPLYQVLESKIRLNAGRIKAPVVPGVDFIDGHLKLRRAQTGQFGRGQSPGGTVGYDIAVRADVGYGGSQAVYIQIRRGRTLAYMDHGNMGDHPVYLGGYILPFAPDGTVICVAL